MHAAAPPRLNGRAAAIASDLESVLDEDTAQAVTAEPLRQRRRVRALAASVPPIMRSGAALWLWGRQPFGIDESFGPIEQRVAAA